MKKQMIFAVALLSTAQVMQAEGDWANMFSKPASEAMEAAKKVGYQAMDELEIKRILVAIEKALNENNFDAMLAGYKKLQNMNQEVVGKYMEQANYLMNRIVQYSREAANLAPEKGALWLNRAKVGFGSAVNWTGNSLKSVWSKTAAFTKDVATTAGHYGSVAGNSVKQTAQAALEEGKNFYVSVSSRSAEDNVHHAVNAVKESSVFKAINANPVGTIAGAVIGNQLFKKSKLDRVIATTAGAVLGNLYLDTTPKAVITAWGCAAVCVLAQFATAEQVQEDKK